MGIEIKEASSSVSKKVVGTQISAALYEQLRTDAETEFMSVSDLLRKIIYLYYRDKNKNCDNVEKESK